MEKILCKQKHSHIWEETNNKNGNEINSRIETTTRLYYTQKKIENFKVNQNSN